MKKEGKEMEPFVKDFSRVIADSKRKWKKGNQNITGLT
jgi:hypothetical protein